MLIHDIESGDIVIDENKSFMDYITEYEVNAENNQIRKLSNAFGVSEEKLKNIMATTTSMTNINEFGKYEDLLKTVDLEKAKKTLEKIYNRELKKYEVNLKVDEILREFIVNDGFDIETIIKQKDRSLLIYLFSWEQRKLSELCNIYDGTHQTPNYKDSGIMFLSVENIKELSSNKYISYEDFKKNFKVYPEKNDILMTRIGDIGTTNIVKENSLKAYYVSLALLKCKSINPYYLNFAIKSDYVQKGLKLRSLLTAIPMKINKDQIGEVDINYPIDSEEQSNIGKLFDNLDNLITLHHRKYSKKLQTWEQRKLKDISSYRRGSFPQPYGKEEWYGGSQAMPFVQVADVNDDLKLNEETKQTISKLAQPMSVYIPKESVIVTLQGTIGKVAITLHQVFVL